MGYALLQILVLLMDTLGCLLFGQLIFLELQGPNFGQFKPAFNFMQSPLAILKFGIIRIKLQPDFPLSLFVPI